MVALAWTLENISNSLFQGPGNKGNVFSVRKGLTMPHFGTYSSNLASCMGHECRQPRSSRLGIQKAWL
jgi:hypothetical protein